MEEMEGGTAVLLMASETLHMAHCEVEEGRRALVSRVLHSMPGVTPRALFLPRPMLAEVSQASLPTSVSSSSQTRSNQPRLTQPRTYVHSAQLRLAGLQIGFANPLRRLIWTSVHADEGAKHNTGAAERMRVVAGDAGLVSGLRRLTVVETNCAILTLKSYDAKTIMTCMSLLLSSSRCMRAAWMAMRIWWREAAFDGYALFYVCTPRRTAYTISAQVQWCST